MDLVAMQKREKGRGMPMYALAVHYIPIIAGLFLGCSICVSVTDMKIIAVLSLRFSSHCALKES